MTRTGIENTLNRLLIEEFEVEPSKITPSASLKADLKLGDSDKSDLAISLEDDLEIRIPEHDEDKWITVKNVVDYLEAKVK
jgi:acyl carrier protein